MSVLADEIEKLILHKLLKEQEEHVVLKRNELADELNCAPSQISYVLSTRFSNDKGFQVESRRGSGGFVRIVRVSDKKKGHAPAIRKEQMPVITVSLKDLDALLYRLLNQQRLGKREAVLLHHMFEALFKEVKDEQQRMAVISRVLASLRMR